MLDRHRIVVVPSNRGGVCDEGPMCHDPKLTHADPRQRVCSAPVAVNGRGSGRIVELAMEATSLLCDD